MEINKKLDTDNDIEFLESGTMCQASNIVVNNINAGIQNEHGIDKYYSLLDADEKIVGYIACSDEFVIFTSNNNIIRCNENTNKQVLVETNWNWQGGQILGAYTYNVNNELIVSITEIDSKEDVPLKIINLDKPNYVVGQTDKKYTLSPEIPKSNLVNWTTVTGSSIYKGMYCLFIRYKQGDDYTPWTSIGYPILIYDENGNTIIEDVSYLYKSKYDGGPVIERFTYTENTNLPTEKVNKNIQLNLEIDDFTKSYEYFQLAYIVNTVKSEIKTFITNDISINERTVIIDNDYSTDISVDDITRTAFNLYNVKTLCNYNNRLYLANYKEENPNDVVSKIDVSRISVTAKSTKTNLNSANALLASNAISDEIEFGQIVTNPSVFKEGLGYVVNARYKLRDSNGNTKEVSIRLFLNRLCYHDIDTTKTKHLYVDVQSLVHAAYFNSGFIDYRSLFYASSATSKDWYRYFVIRPNNGEYEVKIADVSAGSYGVYSELWNRSLSYELPNSDYAKNDYYYGYLNPYSDSINSGAIPYADIKYNTITDFIVDSIDAFKINDVALTTNTSLNPIWFYDSVFTLNGEKTDGEFDFNYSDFPDTTYNIYDLTTNNIAKVGRYYNKIYCWLPKDISSMIQSLHPDSTITYRFYNETINPANGVFHGTTSDVTVHSDNLLIVIGYDTSNKVFKLGRQQINGNKKAFQLFDDTYKVTDKDGNITYHSFDDFIKTIDISVEFPNINKTSQDIADYYAPKDDYAWTEDIEPTEHDFDPNKTYSVILGKYNLNTDVKYELIDISPKAAGFINNGDVVENSKIDKHFIIYYKLTDWLKLIGSSYHSDEYRNVLVDFGTNNASNYKFILGEMYIAFEATDIYQYKGNDVINGWICTLYGDTTINSPIPIFVKYYDLKFAYSLNSSIYPMLRNDEGTTAEIYRDVAFFIDKFTSGGDIEELIYETSVTKSCINKSVYNLFIHYVYPNGSYTDGIQIPNNATVPNNIFLGRGVTDGVAEDIYMDVNEDTTVVNVTNYYNNIKTKYTSIDTTNAHPVTKVLNVLGDVRVFNVFPHYNNRNIALYKNNNGDRLFRGTGTTDPNVHDIYDINNSFKFVFDNIPMTNDFIGYFISYEKTEPIYIGRGPIVAKANDFNTDYTGEVTDVRFYFPEFNITKNNGAGNLMIIEKYLTGGDASRGSLFTDAYDITNSSLTTKPTDSYANIVGIKESKILAPNDAFNGNAGREGVVNLIFNNPIKISTIASSGATRYLTCGILMNIRDNIYMSKNKKLISLGFVKFSTYQEDKTYNYGYEEYPYYYDYYNSIEHVFAFNKDGVNYDEINSIPTRSTDGSLLYPEYHTVNQGTSGYVRAGNTPISRLALYSVSLYPLFAKTIKIDPIEKYYTIATEDNSFVRNVRTIYMYPTYLNDVFEISDVYVDYVSKEITNYNKELYANFITEYKKTIRRSDVIGDESVYNTWKIFRTEQYRVIAENKGNIINVVGIGIYLIAHCEHSMFIFNRDASMKTDNKDVQLVIPDAFDIDYSEVFTSTKGYAGIQRFNQFVCTNYGYIFYDSDAHKIYRFDNKNLDEITPGFKHLFTNEVTDINFAIDESNERLLCLGTIIEKGINKHFAISYSFNIKDWVSTHTYWYKDCFNTKNNTYFINDGGTIDSVDTFIKSTFNNYTSVLVDELNMFKTELDGENKPYSFVDIVFNNNNIDKVLNYITYSINKNTDDNYSGDKLLIYTNCCYSDYINISIPKRSMKDYKNPYYRYGFWVMNWFRNKVANINTKNPIIRRNGKFYENTKINVRRGLDNALIVGKYFVVRIIFRDDAERINLDDIQTY